VSKDIPGSHQADIHSTSAEGFNSRELRNALGSFATGVTIITTRSRSGVLTGMTANSFTSVSLDPPLVLVCIGHDAVMHGVLSATRQFGVSVLASHQEATARHFADRRRPLGLAQFDGVSWRPGRLTGAPLIDGAIAHFECQLWRSYDGGDHTIFLGNLLSMARPADGDALLFFHGRFRQIYPERSEMTA
jgi:flavin reductase